MATRSRWEAVGLWQRVAAGQTDADDVRTWLSEVARNILEADDTKDANDRRTGILKAVGLEGRRGSVEAHAVGVLADGWPDKSPEGMRNLRTAQAFVMGHPIGSKKELDPEILRGRVRSAAAKVKIKK
jgi:hypothetical protein